MFEEIEFTHEDGTNDKNKVTVIALSTCGFCWKGLEFLRKNSIKFRYVYIDKLPLETKTKIKETLFDKYQKKVAFPFIILNEEEVFTGFREEIWREKLLIDQEEN